MILPASVKHKDQIIALWNDAFGDKTEDIKRYLETIFKYFWVYEEDGITKGMLSVLPVSFCGKKGGYIYAVTTHKDHRGQGICNKLMEYVKKNKNYDFLVLKPQNDGLFDFYEKMEFGKVGCLSKKELSVSHDVEFGYQLKKLTPQEYEKLRNAYFDESIIEWDSNMLSFAKDMYGGGFYAVEMNGKTVGLAFLYKNKDELIIKELLTKETCKIADFVGNCLNCEIVKAKFYNIKATESFMIYPKNIKKAYFNIYLD